MLLLCSVDMQVEKNLASIKGWRVLNNPWVPEEDNSVEHIYVNLQLNQEKYTGGWGGEGEVVQGTGGGGGGRVINSTGVTSEGQRRWRGGGGGSEDAQPAVNGVFLGESCRWGGGVEITVRNSW